MNTSVFIPPDLLGRYDQRGPRYTSYPTVPSWSAGFGDAQYRAALQAATAEGSPIALYVHIPYCVTRCLYCGCNAVATSRTTTKDDYLDTLERELRLVIDTMGARPVVAHMHWGGGTPNHLSDEQIMRLFSMIEQRVTFAPDAELSVEADPRLATRSQLELLKELGFNRISFGVQDLDPDVQQAIGRLQPVDLVDDVIEGSRAAGFTAINVDLIYGLPRQTQRSFSDTITRVAEMDPDRLAVFGYAHLPTAFNHQRAIDAAELPKSAERFALFRLAVSQLAAEGYAWVGMDHFARETDALTIAQNAGTLHRDFMGYTTRPTKHLVALGMSGISEVGGAFAQNDARIPGWRAAIESGQLPTVRGHVLTDEDTLRRAAILQMMCNLEMPRAQVDAIDGALARLLPMAEDQLVDIDASRIRVTPMGRYFLRNVCMAFDAYLPQQLETVAFSKTA